MFRVISGSDKLIARVWLSTSVQSFVCLAIAGRPVPDSKARLRGSPGHVAMEEMFGTQSGLGFNLGYGRALPWAKR